MKIFTDFNEDSIAEMIMSGMIGILPCDTLYGLVCAAKNPEAVSRLYELKQREHKPGTVIAATIDQLVDLGLKRRYLTPVLQYWPGAVSVVIPCGVKLGYLHQEVGSLAVRLPFGDALQTLLLRTGPLLTSSANLPGQLPAATIDQAQNYFGTACDFYVDGGDLASRQPSTIVRIVDDAIEVLRAGAVNISE